MNSTALIFIITASLIFFWLILYLIPIGLWFQALVSGVRITLLELLFMRFRKVPPRIIVDALIVTNKAGIDISRDLLEAHCLAGGNVTNVVHALVMAKNSGLSLTFQKASAADLQGIDLMEEVRKETAKRKKEPLFE